MPTDPPTPTTSEAPSEPAGVPSLDELARVERFRGAIAESVSSQLLIYKVWISVLSAVVFSSAAFFSLKSWPDFKKHIDDTQDGIEGRIEKFEKDLRDELPAKIAGQIDTEVAKFSGQILRDFDTKVGEVKQAAEVTERVMRDQTQNAIQAAVTASANVESELTRLKATRETYDKSFQEMQQTDAQIRAEAEALRSRRDSLEHAIEQVADQQKQLGNSLATLDATQNSVINNLKNITANIDDLNASGAKLAKILKEEDLAFALKKLHYDLFHVQQIEARVCVDVPNDDKIAFCHTSAADSLCSIQVNVRRPADKGDFLEFRPSPTTSIGTRFDDGSVGTTYASTLGLWQPFIPKVTGRQIDVLDHLSTITLSSSIISAEDMKQAGPKISEFFGCIRDVRVQLMVNGVMIIDQVVMHPKFVMLPSGRREGDVNFVVSDIALTSEVAHAREIYQSRLSNDDDTASK